MQLKIAVNQKTLVNLKLSLPLLALLSFLPLINNCSTPDDRQGFVPTIYAGDSANAGVTRAQGKETISCEDKKFDEMYCVFDRDMETLFKRCLAQVESEKTWYHFGKPKAGKLTVEKPISKPKPVKVKPDENKQNTEKKDNMDEEEKSELSLPILKRDKGSGK